MSQLAQTFRLLSDESRLRILLALAQNGEMHVTALCDMLAQSQPAVSHHLTLLRTAGLVGYRRAGKFNFYYLDALNLGETLDRLFTEMGRSHTFDMGDFLLTFARRSRRG